MEKGTVIPTSLQIWKKRSPFHQ